MKTTLLKKSHLLTRKKITLLSGDQVVERAVRRARRKSRGNWLRRRRDPDSKAGTSEFPRNSQGKLSTDANWIIAIIFCILSK